MLRDLVSICDATFILYIIINGEEGQTK